MHKIPDEQQHFIFRQSGESPGGLMVAIVVRWGQEVWIRCCPLCGMAHEVRGGPPADGIFKPLCIVRQFIPAVHTKWTARFPEAANYRQVRLTGLEEIAILPTGESRPGRVAA